MLLPTDWLVFDYYAAKIRELGFDPRAPSPSPSHSYSPHSHADAPPPSIDLESWRATGVPLSAFMALCVVRLPRTLLPHVRCVRWTTHEFRADAHVLVYILQNAPLEGLYLDFRDLKMKVAPPEPEPEPEPEEGEEDSDGEDEDEDGEGEGGEGEQEEGEATPQPAPVPLPAQPAPPPPPSFEEDMYIKYTLKALLEECPRIRDVEIIAPQFEGFQWAVKDFVRAMRDKIQDQHEDKDKDAGTKTGTGAAAGIALRTFAINLQADRKSTRLNSSHSGESRMPSSA